MTLPRTLALIDHDRAYAEALAQYLSAQGAAVRWFTDSDDFLVSEGAYDFDFYVMDTALPGIDGLDLIRLLRKRTEAGVVVITAQARSSILDDVLGAGGDMYLPKPARFEQVALAVKTVHRRAMPTPQQRVWRLEAQSARLISPEGINIGLSETDVAVLSCFVEAGDGRVHRERLCERLGRAASEENENWLHATIYRLRRRIERATNEVVPLQSQPRVGYVFRGQLTAR